MSDTTADTKALIHRLAHEIAVIIGVFHTPDDFLRAAPSLPALYKARPFGPLPEDVQTIIAKIEQAIKFNPHYACRDCNALFHDTDDLEALTEAEIKLLDPQATPPVGHCPVCRGEVEAREARK